MFLITLLSSSASTSGVQFKPESVNVDLLAEKVEDLQRQMDQLRSETTHNVTIETQWKTRDKYCKTILRP